MKDARGSSRFRQALRQTEEQRTQHVQALLDERGPVVRGTFRFQGGRCGNPRCKCSRGELHEKAALYVSDQGKLRCTYVPVTDRERVQQLNHRYQHFRKARAALAKLGRKTLELADSLQEALTEPYPPPDRTTKNPEKPRRKRRREEPSS